MVRAALFDHPPTQQKHNNLFDTSRWKALPEAATPVKHHDHLGFRGPIKTSTEAAVHYPGFAPSEVQRVQRLKHQFDDTWTSI